MNLNSGNLARSCRSCDGCTGLSQPCTSATAYHSQLDGKAGLPATNETAGVWTMIKRHGYPVAKKLNPMDQLHAEVFLVEGDRPLGILTFYNGHQVGAAAECPERPSCRAVLSGSVSECWHSCNTHAAAGETNFLLSRGSSTCLCCCRAEEKPPCSIVCPKPTSPP